MKLTVTLEEEELKEALLNYIEKEEIKRGHTYDYVDIESINPTQVVITLE